MSEELEPCPFCGGGNLEALEVETGADEISCADCNAVGPNPYGAPTWNNRPETFTREQVTALLDAERDLISSTIRKIADKFIDLCDGSEAGKDIGNHLVGFAKWAEARKGANND